MSRMPDRKKKQGPNHHKRRVKRIKVQTGATHPSGGRVRRSQEKKKPKAPENQDKLPRMRWRLSDAAGLNSEN